MANSKQVYGFQLLFAALFLISSPALAQRGINYEQLANQQREQSIFIDTFTLPSIQPGTLQFVNTFRIDYNLLPFKKYDQATEEKNFFSPVGMNIEVFKDDNPNFGNRRRDDFSVEGLEPVNRSFWKDTAFAANYAQTKAKNSFITGELVSELQPGTYSYMLQFVRGEEVEGQASRKRSVKLQSFEDRKKGEIILAESVDKSSGNNTINLLNFGDFVYYGEDFNAFIQLPGYQSSDSFSYTVHRVDISSRDTTNVEAVHSGMISGDQIYESVRPELNTENSSAELVLKNAEQAPSYALVKIPNSEFINAIYRLEVTRDGEQTPVAETIFRSRWIDMPTSLLNVNVAIDMLRFIVDDQTLKEMKSGSNGEKEKKFRAFWEKRDPTPKTEYNELMAEYYRRVDYAYQEFSTINVSGYNTDQGSVYIRFGPPKNINRKFPPGEPALEIWEYNNRTFVFRAVTGFGEFKLVSDQG